MMDTARFTALVAKIEASARANPRAYLLRLLALTAMGYAYIAAILLAMVALFCFSLLVILFFGLERWSLFGFGAHWLVQGLMLGILATMYHTIRGLCARVPAPHGLPLKRRQAPALFEAIEDARRAARAPRIHRVLLTDNFNAGVLQRPLLGTFGWYRNELLIGLPLLDAMTPDEMQAVLAHEIGHLSSGHSRFAGRILAVRRTWMSLLDGMSDRFVRFLFTGFVQSYSPYFEAYSLVMARDQEREADRIAAGLAGSRALADALIKLRVQSAHIYETFGPALARRADVSPEPPAAYFDELRDSLGARVSDEEARKRLAAALAEEPDPTDTHPSLKERLAALNEPPRVPPTGEVTAADYLLGACLVELRAQMNQAWQSATRERWQEQYQEAQASAARLAELEEQAERQPLTLRELWEQAMLTGQVYGNQWAVPRYRRLVHLRPHSPFTRLALAQALLAERDDAGLDALRQAVRLSPVEVTEALCLAEDYLRQDARLDELAAFRQEFEVIQRKVDADGNGFTDWQPDHTYLPHGVSDAELAPVRELLESCPHLESAYLARWVWPAFPDVTIYILALTATTSSMYKPESYGEIVAHLYRAPEFPGKTAMYVSWGRKKPIDKVIAAVEGTLIFKKGQTAANQNRDRPRLVA